MTILSPLYDQALVYAAQLHRRQARKRSQADEPYQTLGDVLAAQHQQLPQGLLREYQQQLAWVLQLVAAVEA
ncbi:MAG: hypothetical protein HC926_03500 [Synechococcaceae cyanobacterium SM2_3_60]|nr:hypothetical protein [Synechococcaceae cyanobacterium SM2_3_60]